MRRCPQGRKHRWETNYLPLGADGPPALIQTSPFEESSEDLKNPELLLLLLEVLELSSQEDVGTIRSNNLDENEMNDDRRPLLLSRLFWRGIVGVVELDTIIDVGRLLRCSRGFESQGLLPSTCSSAFRVVEGRRDVTARKPDVKKSE